MRAVMVEQTGGPEVLIVRDRPVPQVGSGELLVRVAAAGVNFIDTYQRSGSYPRELPFVIGLEGSGIVEAIADDVDGFAVGDRVAWAMQPGGGYAEQVTIAASAAIRVPSNVESELAAAAMLQGMTAHFLCSSTFEVQAGQTVLVHAAAGGLGLLLTQLITARGGRVIGTTSTEQKAEAARAAGAAEIIRYDHEDVVSRLRELTDGAGVPVVYDGVGRDTFESSLDCLAPRGTLVLFGAASGPVPPVDPQTLNSHGSLFLTRPSLGHYVADRAELEWRAGAVLSMVADGELDVRIGQRYELGQAGQAHRDLESRSSSGKLLIVP